MGLQFPFDNEDGGEVSSRYPTFLSELGIFLLPYIITNPIKVALTLQQIQYSPFTAKVIERPDSQLPNEQSDFHSPDTQELLPVDSLGYIQAAKEDVIGTCVLEDGSVLSTLLLGSTSVPSSVKLASFSFHSLFGVLVNKFGISVLWKNITNRVLVSYLRNFIKRLIFLTSDQLLFDNITAMSDKHIWICSELISEVCARFLFLPFEVANLRLLLQSRAPTEQKYSTLFSLLLGFRQEEGGFFHSTWSRFGLASFLFYLLASLFSIGKTTLLSREPLFLFLSDIVNVLISQPFYIARLRLMAQFMPPNHTCTMSAVESNPFFYWSGFGTSPLLIRRLSVIRPYIVIISLSPLFYTGIFNAICRIYKEEGFASLYTGWKVRLLSLFLQSLWLYQNELK